jgi:hypothetical protein
MANVQKRRKATNRREGMTSTARGEQAQFGSMSVEPGDVIDGFRFFGDLSDFLILKQPIGLWGVYTVYGIAAREETYVTFGVPQNAREVTYDEVRAEVRRAYPTWSEGDITNHTHIAATQSHSFELTLTPTMTPLDLIQRVAAEQASVHGDDACSFERFSIDTRLRLIRVVLGEITRRRSGREKHRASARLTVGRRSGLGLHSPV